MSNSDQGEGLIADSHAFLAERYYSEPTLLPHIARALPVRQLGRLMTVLNSIDSAEYSYSPRLVEACSAAVAARMKNSHQQLNLPLLTYHKQLFSYINEPLLDSALELLLQRPEAWSEQDYAERACRLAARFPAQEEGLLIELAAAAYLSLPADQALVISAWYLPLAEGAERKEIINCWLNSNWLDIRQDELAENEIASIAALLEHSNQEEFVSLVQSIRSTLVDQTLSKNSLGVIVSLLAKTSEVSVELVNSSLLSLYNEEVAPSWKSMVLSRGSGQEINKELFLDVPQDWKTWIKSLFPLSSDKTFEDVQRAHIDADSSSAGVSNIELSSSDAIAAREQIYHRWSKLEQVSGKARGIEPEYESMPNPSTETSSHTANDRVSSQPPVAKSAKKATMHGTPQKSNKPRRLQTDISIESPEGERPMLIKRAFVAGLTHQLSISIGRGGSIQVAGGGIIQPDFDSNKESEELQVRLVYNEITQSGSIKLQKDTMRNSTIWQTEILVPEGAHEVDVLLVVLHRDRVLQAAKLQGFVVASVDAASQSDDSISFTVTEVANNLSDLEQRQNFDASIVSDGKTGAAFAGKNIGVRDLKGVDKTIEKMTDKLFKTSEAVVMQGSDGDLAQYQKLLVYLAANGKLLHKVLIKHLMPSLDQAQRIQIISTNPSAMLPLEFVYAGPSPKSNATLCDGWQDALSSGRCSNCQQLASDQRSATICPLHFWGLSKVIERHTSLSPQATDQDFFVNAQSSTQRQHLAPLKSAVFSASDNVPEELVDSTFATLKSAVVSCDDARTWDEWANCIAEKSPSLLVSMPHNALDPILEISTLEIGNGDELRAGEVGRRFVCSDVDDIRPVVLLLGCQTARGGPQPFHTFVGEFRHSGAAIVIGTLATVLGEHAAPVVQAIIRELQRPTVANENTIGDLLLRIRKQMFAQGILIALAVAAFGDADWALADSTAESEN